MNGGVMSNGESIGWRVAGYALARLTPKEASSVSSVAVWEDYLRWCAQSGLVPVAEAVFLGAFDDVVKEAGIGQRKVGAHVSYVDVALAEG